MIYLVALRKYFVPLLSQIQICLHILFKINLFSSISNNTERSFGSPITAATTSHKHRQKDCQE